MQVSITLIAATALGIAACSGDGGSADAPLGDAGGTPRASEGPQQQAAHDAPAGAAEAVALSR